MRNLNSKIAKHFKCWDKWARWINWRNFYRMQIHRRQSLKPIDRFVEADWNAFTQRIAIFYAVFENTIYVISNHIKHFTVVINRNQRWNIANIILISDFQCSYLKANCSESEMPVYRCVLQPSNISLNQLCKKKKRLSCNHPCWFYGRSLCGWCPYSMCM